MASGELARDTIAAIATPAGRGGIGVVRVSGPAVAEVAARSARAGCREPRIATLCAFRDARGEPRRRGHRAVLPGAAFLHRRAGAGAAGPWRTGGDAGAARRLPGCRRAPRRARRIHAARLPRGQARPGAGRSGRRPDRRREPRSGALRAALAQRRVLRGGRPASRRSWSSCAR